MGYQAASRVVGFPLSLFRDGGWKSESKLSAPKPSDEISDFFQSITFGVSDDVAPSTSKKVPKARTFRQYTKRSITEGLLFCSQRIMLRRSVVASYKSVTRLSIIHE